MGRGKDEPTLSETPITVGTGSDYVNEDKDIQAKVRTAMSSVSFFTAICQSNKCILQKVNLAYNLSKKTSNSLVDLIVTKPTPTPDLAPDKFTFKAPQLIYKEDTEQALNICVECFTAAVIKEKSTDKNGDILPPPVSERSPFDRRLDRLWQFEDHLSLQTPFDPAQSSTSIEGLYMGLDNIENSNVDPATKKETTDKVKGVRSVAKTQKLNQGPPSLMNEYSLTTLYGLDGGKSLVNKRNTRKWYEVDSAGFENKGGYSSTPTTSAIISWGAQDPYKRTPYAFTDFVFSKHWNKIENNRLITLRRYAAPIYDNLKFPGMAGDGDNGGILFPPLASAITYFGEETENDLNSLLKFTTGVNWGEAEAKVWTVNSTATPDNEKGPAAIFGGIGKVAKYLSVFSGKVDNELLMNSGQMPPDPYNEGPYANRMLGPINRIDKVKKREPGINFKWDGLNIVFEYVARPVGGINPKAILLDIMSNFLIIGSAKAVFFGGQHRFMNQPQIYPFAGGDSAMKDWYTGNPIGWASKTINNFTTQVQEKGGILDGFKDLFGSIFKDGFSGILTNLKKAATGDNAATRVGKNILASKSKGQIPYLTGMKAVLTGEPVGDWHVTIGNPLNPISMIGNLICSGIEVEFGSELGPDDFPTEIKVKVNLEHGMDRDRDGIQSIFNRGMGRIYTLPDEFGSSSDKETGVDRYTGKYGVNGNIASVKSGRFFTGVNQSGGNADKASTGDPTNSGDQSVWNHGSFSVLSPDKKQNQINEGVNTNFRSAFTKVDWIAIKSLS